MSVDRLRPVTPSKQQQRVRRLALDAERDAFNMRQAKEAGHLTLMQAALKAGIDVQRQQGKSGVVGFLKRITGIGPIIDYKNRNKDRALDQTQKTEAAALARRHDGEQRDPPRCLPPNSRRRARESQSSMPVPTNPSRTGRSGEGGRKSSQSSPTSPKAPSSTPSTMQRRAARSSSWTWRVRRR
jgi:hypothetical protein